MAATSLPPCKSHSPLMGEGWSMQEAGREAQQGERGMSWVWEIGKDAKEKGRTCRSSDRAGQICWEVKI